MVPRCKAKWEYQSLPIGISISSLIWFLELELALMRLELELAYFAIELPAYLVPIPKLVLKALPRLYLLLFLSRVFSQSLHSVQVLF